MEDPLALIPSLDDENIPDLDGLDDDDDDEEEEEEQQQNQRKTAPKTRAHQLAQATKGKSLDFNDQFQFDLVRRTSSSKNRFFDSFLRTNPTNDVWSSQRKTKSTAKR